MALRFFKYFAGTLLVLIIVTIISILLVQRFSDGPIEPMQGGPFKTGEVITEPVTDWSFAAGRNIEFELVGPGTSRVAGFIMHDGHAYMTCDLGFIWNRFENSNQRRILQTLYIFKRWHQDAQEDGRARIRTDGKIYRTHFVKVTDPELNSALRGKLEALAQEYFSTPLPSAPAEPPNDVWFFRMDPPIPDAAVNPARESGGPA